MVLEGPLRVKMLPVYQPLAASDGPRFGNRDVISTGIRSYQVGSLGGVTCGIESCGIERFPADADLLDVNTLSAAAEGAVIDAEEPASRVGPAWRRARDDRFYVFLLDERSRTVHVAVIHPGNVPATARTLLPAMPTVIARRVVDDLRTLRLPR
jgi:hypothetical protein